MTRKYINPGPIEFDATIGGDSRGEYIDFPYDLKETYGVRNLVPMIATFDGRVSYRGSLTKMGRPQAMLLLRKDVRGALGKGPGDSVHVHVVLDDMPRTIAIPTDIKKTLEAAGLLDDFEHLAFTHRREYVEWIENAKKPETRLGRMEKMVTKLSGRG